MLIGNIAHGVGALLGILLGKAVVSGAPQRSLYVAALLPSMALFGLASTVARPYVNWSREPGSIEAEMAYGELRFGNPAGARDLFEKALAENRLQPCWWHSLGKAHRQLKNLKKAHEAFERAWRFAREATGIKKRRAAILKRESHYDEAAVLYDEAAENSPRDPRLAFHLGQMLEYADLLDESVLSFKRAMELQPANDTYRKELESAKRKQRLRARGGAGPNVGTDGEASQERSESPEPEQGGK